MFKDIYFGVQIALLILSGCAASDFCYRGILPWIYAAVIIIACAMSLYSPVMCYLRVGKRHAKSEYDENLKMYLNFLRMKDAVERRKSIEQQRHYKAEYHNV